MKRALSFLLLIVVLVYGKQGYDIYLSNRLAEAPMKGVLSDIAEEVVAIPLQTTGDVRIEKVRNIRQEGQNLFLISNNSLYRFTNEGRFVCRITNPEDIRVAGYVLNPISQELIVLGNSDDIFYYSFDGILKDKKKLKSNLREHRLQSFTMVGNQIWTVEEDVYTNEDTMQATIRKRVVTYDIAFNQLQSQNLQPVDVGRNRLMASMHQPQLYVNSDTGQVYAYAPEMYSNHLLRDTLYLNGTWRRQFNYEGSVPLSPVRMGGRFWIASYTDPMEGGYTFCYDTVRHKYCEVKGGLWDDYYHTGSVTDLEAMDIHHQSYAFCRSGEVAKKAFPDGKAGDNTVVFILKLKA